MEHETHGCSTSLHMGCAPWSSPEAWQQVGRWPTPGSSSSKLDVLPTMAVTVQSESGFVFTVLLLAGSVLWVQDRGNE